MVNNNTDVVISRISFSYYNIIQYMSIIYLLTIWIQIVAYIVLLQLFLLIFPTFFATSIIKWQHDNQTVSLVLLLLSYNTKRWVEA